jgi:hypothetical protein
MLKFNNMKIQPLGQQGFTISASPAKGENVKIVIDSGQERKTVRNIKTKADILILSRPAGAKPTEKSVFTVDGPGEYDAKKVFIRGLAAYDSDNQPLAIYLLEVEAMKVAYLGGFGQKQLSSEQEEKLASADILIIPVAGDKGLSLEEAAAVVSRLQPKIVIPSGYGRLKLRENSEKLEKFLKKIGAEPPERKKEALIKKKDLPEDGLKSIVLFSANQKR